MRPARAGSYIHHQPSARRSRAARGEMVVPGALCYAEKESGGRLEYFPIRSGLEVRAYPEYVKVHPPPRIPADHARHRRHSAPRSRSCGITTQQDRHRVACAPRLHHCGPISGQWPGLEHRCSNVWPPREPARHETTPCQAPTRALGQRASDVGESSP